MSIYFNGQVLGIQPSQLQEGPLQIQTDVTAIDGSQQRNHLGQKYMAQMSFINLTISGYQQIMGLIGTGSGIVYTNDLSAETANGILTFSGLPNYTKYPYVPGSSLYQQLDVEVRQT